MGENMWVVAKDGQQLQDTLSSAQVAELLREGSAAEFLIWREGMDQWTDPREVAEVAALLPPPAAGPPPVSPVPKTGGKVFHVASSSAAAKGRGLGGVTQHVGFVRSLFDFRFDAFITPRLITTFYVLGMIVVGITFLALLFSGFTSIVSGIKFSRWGMVFMGFLWLVLAPVLSIIYLAFVRMFFELVMVLFKIKDGITTLADRD
ncbi:MAG: DUF4282 domain-containing protein [Thermoanaerobaculales bacterium]|nr:DUF4282 domain-containing protein [Thermoanaerobaculales bacterium]